MQCFCFVSISYFQNLLSFKFYRALDSFHDAVIDYFFHCFYFLTAIVPYNVVSMESSSLYSHPTNLRLSLLSSYAIICLVFYIFLKVVRLGTLCLFTWLIDVWVTRNYLLYSTLSRPIDKWPMKKVSRNNTKYQLKQLRYFLV